LVSFFERVFRLECTALVSFMPLCFLVSYLFSYRWGVLSQGGIVTWGFPPSEYSFFSLERFYLFPS
jgi:hypothetical protein